MNLEQLQSKLSMYNNWLHFHIITVEILNKIQCILTENTIVRHKSKEIYR